MAPGTAESIERIAGGFQCASAPVWFRDGYLLFSDAPARTLYACNATGRFSKIPARDGSSGPSLPFSCGGATLDRSGKLVLCDNSAARIIRRDSDDVETVLADRFEGRRLNGPRDLAYRSDGSLYFTDPPRPGDEEATDLPFNGVFRMVEGRRLQLLAADIRYPAGLAFSPHENFLYVANAEPERMTWMRYKVERDGMLSSPVVFHEASAELEDGARGALIVDRTGNVLATGPGGVWILAPTGEHIGTLRIPEPATGLTWGGDGTQVYVAARTSIYRVRWPIGGNLT
jgi:gluconolactonase